MSLPSVAALFLAVGLLLGLRLLRIVALGLLRARLDPGLLRSGLRLCGSGVWLGLGLRLRRWLLDGNLGLGLLDRGLGLGLGLLYRGLGLRLGRGGLRLDARRLVEALGAALRREGHAERVEQSERLGVACGGRGDRDVEAANLVDRVVVDLREDDLLLDAHRVVAAAVERARVQPPEVADPRDRDRDEAIEELVAALPAQGHGHADRHALAQFEGGDRLARPAHARLLTGDRGQLIDGGFERFGVLLGLPDAHVQRDLLEPRRLHHRRVPEAADERGADLLEVAGLQARGRGCLGHGRHRISRTSRRSAWPLSPAARPRARWLHGWGCLWHPAASRWTRGSGPRARSRHRARLRCALPRPVWAARGA